MESRDTGTGGASYPPMVFGAQLQPGHILPNLGTIADQNVDTWLAGAGPAVGPILVH